MRNTKGTCASALPHPTHPPPIRPIPLIPPIFLLPSPITRHHKTRHSRLAARIVRIARAPLVLLASALSSSPPSAPRCRTCRHPPKTSPSASAHSAETGVHYENAGIANPALSITCAQGYYTGTHITLIAITAADMDAFHTRLSYRLSKPIPLANAAHLHPYARLGGSVLTSRGGAIRNGHQRLRLNIDGARMELGLGAVWQPAAAHQLHLDYEVSHGEKYAQLWGLTAGYRWQF